MPRLKACFDKPRGLPDPLRSRCVFALNKAAVIVSAATSVDGWVRSSRFCFPLQIRRISLEDGLKSGNRPATIGAIKPEKTSLI